MTDRGRLAILLVFLALTVGLLVWATSGRVQAERCYWAVTYGTHQYGYQEVPCDATLQEKLRYLEDHPETIHPGTPPGLTQHR
jgi:hypothetical protein